MASTVQGTGTYGGEEFLISIVEKGLEDLWGGLLVLIVQESVEELSWKNHWSPQFKRVWRIYGWKNRGNQALAEVGLGEEDSINPSALILLL